MTKVVDVPDDTDTIAIYPEEFRYLRELRESGAVNMFGAAPWLSSVFGHPLPEAREILRLWMETFREGD